MILLLINSTIVCLFQSFKYSTWGSIDNTQNKGDNYTQH